MKMYFSQTMERTCPPEEDYSPLALKDCIEKTRQALETAYAGFDNALEFDLIDSYIYEINSLQIRYKHLTNLASLELAAEEEKSDIHSPIRTLVSHVFG